MTDFAEISRTGTSIELTNLGGGSVAQKLIGKPGYFVKIIQIKAFSDGALVEFDLPDKQATTVALFSDNEGFFGRKCPSCSAYFRSSVISNVTYCPYCAHQGYGTQFYTKNQKSFIQIFVTSMFNAFKTGENSVISLDDISQNLPTNSQSPWIYKEETQQTRFTCQECKVETDILGEYALCPNCGRHNCDNIFFSKLKFFEQKFIETTQTNEERHEREAEWEKLLRCVSEFEGLANELKTFLSILPMTQKRRNDLKNLSFQRILNANDRINDWYGFEIFEGITEDEKKFVNIMFNKRHLFTHKNGIVDQEYLHNTNDTKVRIKELVRLRSKEIGRLLPLIRQMAQNLINGFHSIKPLSK